GGIAFLQVPAGLYPTAVAVEPAGSVYVAGWTESNDVAAKTVTHVGSPHVSGYHLFIAKLERTGTGLEYILHVHSNLARAAYMRDSIAALAIDGGGYAYLTGVTNATNFPTVNAAFSTPQSAVYDAFAAKIAPDGRSFLYST